MSRLQLSPRGLISRVNVVEQVLKHELLERLHAFVGSAQRLSQMRSGVLSVEFSAHRTVCHNKTLVWSADKRLILQTRKEFTIVLSAQAVENGGIELNRPGFTEG